MPAFSELEANTPRGKLWIMGTPVFEKYYTRFAWHKNNEKPTVSFLDKSKAKACKVNGNDQAAEGDQNKIPASLLQEDNREQVNYRRVKFEDLRQPDWLRGLATDLTQI